MPFILAAFETAMGLTAAAEAAAAATAASVIGAEFLTAAAVPELAATAAGAEALGTAGTAAAIPEAAMGINAINPELYASAVNSGAVNPATALSDIPGLAEKLANLQPGEALSNPNALAEANRFGAGQMANQGIMGANPYAQITASNTSGPMAATPLPAPVPAGSVLAPPAPPAAPFALDGSYVEATGSPNPEYFRSPTPAEPPGFFDKLSDALSPLQKGFQTAQKFAKENPLATGLGLTALSRMGSSGDSMPDTAYNGPVSKYKINKNFKGRFADPRSFRTAASGGIIDYKEGGTTEKPLTHADMGIAIDDNPQTNKLNPLAAAIKRNKRLRELYGISIPEMQAPTPINDGTQSAAHGGIMQVKRFVYGGEAGYSGGYDGEGAGVDGEGEAPGSGTSVGFGTPGTRGTGLLGNGPGGLFGPVNTGGLSGYSGPGGANSGFGGGGYGSDFGSDTSAATSTTSTPTTNIDNLRSQYVNPDMYRSTTDPYAHYAKYDNEDYNYLRTPTMSVRSSAVNALPSNTNMANVLNSIKGTTTGTGTVGTTVGKGTTGTTVGKGTTGTTVGTGTTGTTTGTGTVGTTVGTGTTGTTTGTTAGTTAGTGITAVANPPSRDEIIAAINASKLEKFSDADAIAAGRENKFTDADIVKGLASKGVTGEQTIGAFTPAGTTRSSSEIENAIRVSREQGFNDADIATGLLRYLPDSAAVTAALAANPIPVKKNVGGDINSYAQGGISSLGGYARGGMPRLLDGPGDGMSDNIPATINDRQPARLADGEFVVPADVVSHLGNGSTKAGSKRLHLMMDQVRRARTGNPKQGKRINPNKFMPR